jgi:hypothetical protein
VSRLAVPPAGLPGLLPLKRTAAQLSQPSTINWPAIVTDAATAGPAAATDGLNSKRPQGGGLAKQQQQQEQEQAGQPLLWQHQEQ